MSINRAVWLAVALGLFAGTGCTQTAGVAGDPKGRLTGYVRDSFAVKRVEDRAGLLGYLSGDAKLRLASWSDEQFRQAFMATRRDLEKVSFREVKPINDHEVSVTYEIEYADHGRGTANTGARVTAKKLAEMVRGPEGLWTIADLHNIKELIEYQNEMNFSLGP